MFFKIYVLIFIINSTFAQYGENFNSCADSCLNDFENKYILSLDTGLSDNKDNQLVEILDEDFEKQNCSKNALIRIPFFNLKKDTIIKIELAYGEHIEGTTIHIGNSPTNDLNGSDRNTTVFNSEIYTNNANFNYYMNSVYLCDQGLSNESVLSKEQISRLLYLNESIGIISPKSKLIIYVSEKWFRIDNIEKGTSFYYNNNYLFTFFENNITHSCKHHTTNSISPYLYIGLNRVIADNSILPGKGLCEAKISMINCLINPEPDMKINVKDLRYTYGDGETLFWISPLNYLEPTLEHSICSAQGVVKLKFDPKGAKKIAKFELEFGEDVSGYSFNIGDSSTNNAFGGDSGSTSNSAEVHSKDNRFYIWLNTKYCGETLLHKIEYNLIESFENLTIYVSDQRIEIKNSRGFHEIYKNKYLYQLNEQNVTCNCFDTRCYPGITPDNDVYFSINRVIGGSFRTGLGLCQANISWLSCSKNVKNNELFEYEESTAKIVMNTGNPLAIGSSTILTNETFLNMDSISSTASNDPINNEE